MKTFVTNPPKDFALMLLGKPGSGKSTFACRFPRPFVINTDMNLRGPCAQLATEGITDIWYDDEITHHSDGSEVPLPEQYARFNKALVAAIALPDRDSVIIDNSTQLCDMICADIIRQSNGKVVKMGIPEWGQFLAFWTAFCLKIRGHNNGKRIILVVHEQMEKDEDGGALKYMLAIPGKTGERLPALFTDVWRCEVGTGLDPVAKMVVPVRQIRTVQDNKHEYLKTSIPSLPTVFPATQDWMNKILPTL